MKGYIDCRSSSLMSRRLHQGIGGRGRMPCAATRHASSLRLARYSRRLCGYAVPAALRQPTLLPSSQSFSGMSPQARLYRAAQPGVASFSLTMPATISATLASRSALAGSSNSTMPNNTV
jgi:hypothetical protein